MIAFRESIAGQHIVRHHGGRRHEQLVGDDQVLVQHRRVNLVLIGVTHECVVTQRKKRLDRIGIPIGHGTKHLTGVRHVATHHDIGVGISPDFFRGRLEHLGYPVGIGRMLLIPQLFGLLLIREHIVKCQFGLWNDVWIEAAQRFPPHDIQIAGHRTQNRVQADRRRRRNLHIGDGRPGNNRPVGRCIEPRGLGNQCLINACNG